MTERKPKITNYEYCSDCRWAVPTEDFKYTDMYICTFQLPPWVGVPEHKRLVSPYQTCSFHTEIIKEIISD